MSQGHIDGKDIANHLSACVYVSLCGCVRVTSEMSESVDFGSNLRIFENLLNGSMLF